MPALGAARARSRTSGALARVLAPALGLDRHPRRSGERPGLDGLQAEAERRRTDSAGFRVEELLRSTAGASTLVMHRLPAHRDEEIASDVLDGPRSFVLDQAENRFHVPKAFLAESLEGR